MVGPILVSRCARMVNDHIRTRRLACNVIPGLKMLENAAAVLFPSHFRGRYYLDNSKNYNSAGLNSVGWRSEVLAVLGVVTFFTG